MTQPEQRQALVDTFINAIYLYDDKVLITFNYKEGTETVAFGEAVKAEKSSDMSARGAPNSERQIVRFGVLFYAGKRLHAFCTPFAHLPESGTFHFARAGMLPGSGLGNRSLPRSSQSAPAGACPVCGRTTSKW